MDSDFNEEIKQLSFIKKRIEKRQLEMDGEDEEEEAPEINRLTPKFYDSNQVISNIDTFDENSYAKVFLSWSVGYSDSDENLKVTFYLFLIVF